MNLLSVLRKRAGLSQEEVAERMGVTPNTISNWETCGKFKKSTDLHRLLDLYKASQKDRAIICQGIYGDERSSEYAAASLINDAVEASYLALTAVQEALNILTKVYAESTLLRELTVNDIEDLEFDARDADVNK